MFSDLCSMMEIPSIEGYWYFVTFTDNHSWYTSLSLCKSKDDTLALFKIWKAWAEKETGKSLKTFCSDGGRAYLSLAFSQYLASSGVKCEVTNMYTPRRMGYQNMRTT